MSWMFRCAPACYRSIAPYNHSRDSVCNLHLSPYDGLSEVHILRKFSLLVLVGVFGWAPWMFGQSADSATGPKLEWYRGVLRHRNERSCFPIRSHRTGGGSGLR